MLVRKGLITKANIGVSTLFQHEATRFSSSSHTPAPYVSSLPLISPLLISFNFTFMNCLSLYAILIRLCIYILLLFIHLQYDASVFTYVYFVAVFSLFLGGGGPQRSISLPATWFVFISFRTCHCLIFLFLLACFLSLPHSYSCSTLRLHASSIHSTLLSSTPSLLCWLIPSIILLTRQHRSLFYNSSLPHFHLTDSVFTSLIKTSGEDLTFFFLRFRDIQKIYI